ncbi:hypothetical protein GCM10017784_33930 [Deinococcus indicus]|uniref:hypothetical protein n=1 Tax=Deinococcus indicus TaxID=223556 RepID=UPI00174E2326|nr:hypothetical protein [Deinococcus indicus]GHG36846.1 hypothetical protein GCM10017784_33930 [Deinococcus indicus]
MLNLPTYIPTQAELEAELGGPLLFHGLFAPPLPETPMRSAIHYRRNWRGEPQIITILSAPFHVPNGDDAALMQVLLEAEPLADSSSRTVRLTTEEFQTRIRAINPDSRLDATNLYEALLRMQLAGYAIHRPTGNKYTRILEGVAMEMTNPGGQASLRAATVTIGDFTLQWIAEHEAH